MDMSLKSKALGLVSKGIEKVRRNGVFCAGFFLLALIGMAYVFAGDGIVIPRPHDTLDYDVVAYALFAEHPFEDFYPEVMGGIDSSTLRPTVLAPAILYMLFSPVVAFAINVAFAMLIAYSSLYCAARYLGARRWIATVVAFAYALVPFQPTFGLTAMYMPIVLCAVYQIISRKKRFFPYLLITLYGFFSSLAVGGFVVVAFLSVICVYGFVRYGRGVGCRMLLLLCALLVVYVFENIDLISSTFIGDAASPSHRVEFDLVATATPFAWESVFSFFVFGYYHAEASQPFLALFLGVFVVAVWIRKMLFFRSHTMLEGKNSILFKTVMGCLLLCAGIALFVVVFRSGTVAEIRSNLPGSLGSFQFDRLYFLYPILWYLASACAFELVMRFFSKRQKAIIAYILIALVLFFTLGYSARWSSQLQTIGAEAFGIDSNSITWRDYYAEDIFTEIEDYLSEEGYGNPSDYKVASLGMYPAVSLYNGFQALDGYSNNYPLEYKHAFRSVIAEELALSDYEAGLYDSWGNECVLVSHELRHAMNIPKDSNREVNESKLDIGAFKDLGGRFILSAVRINNADEIGLREMRSFSSQDSYYEVWLYEAL